MRFYVWCAIGISLLACGKDQVEDRVQVTPGAAPRARKPVVKFLRSKTEARIEYTRFIEKEKEKEKVVNPLFPWTTYATETVKTTDVRCVVSPAGELGVIVQDRELQLSLVAPRFQTPRFSTLWTPSNHGTITYTDSIFSREPEVVSFGENSTCSLVTTSNLTRTEGILRCKHLEGFSKKESKKIEFEIIAKFNCPTGR